MADGEQIIHDIIGTFSLVIVELSKSLEKQGTGFQRRQFSTTLREAANRVPTDAENRQMIKDILHNLAADVGGDGTKPTPIKFLMSKK